MSLALLLSTLLFAPNQSDWFIPWLDKVESFCDKGGPAAAKKALILLGIGERGEGEGGYRGRGLRRYRRGCCKMFLEESRLAKTILEAAIKRFKPAIKKLDSSLKTPAKRLLLFNLHRDLGKCCLSLGRNEEAEKHLEMPRPWPRTPKRGSRSESGSSPAARTC